MGSEPYDVIVLGAGPAGLTAAIYTARARLRTLVITGPMVGGQIAFTYQVENYPGFPDGISGPELVRLMRMQAERFGAEFLEDEATSVDLSGRPFQIQVGEKRYAGETVIIATGSKSRRLGVEAEERLMGRGVFVCATCDAALYEGKRVIVVGGGDSALQEALDLARFAREVVIVHRREELKACLCLKSQARESGRIRFLVDTAVDEILGESRVEGVRLRSLRTGEVSTLDCDGVLVAVGWEPNTDLFKGQLEVDGRGYIASKTEPETSVKGVYVCGDVAEERHRQVVTACAGGCRAALEAERYLERLRVRG